MARDTGKGILAATTFTTDDAAIGACNEAAWSEPRTSRSSLLLGAADRR